MRYVIIDHRSGYIVAMLQADDPVSACQLSDQAGNKPVRNYEAVDALKPHEAGYRVYDADGGCAPITRITDGKDAHLIELVEQECPLVVTMRWSN